MSRLISLIVTLFLALLISGCNTLSVEIIVSDSVSQNEPFTYEAVADPDAVGDVAYEWYLDGRIISSLALDNAIISTSGNHVLSVRITDEEGETGEAETTLEVIPAEILNTEFSVNVSVLDIDENALQDVNVVIDGIVVASDENGVSAFTGLTQTPVLVVAATKAGYIPQSYRFDISDSVSSTDIKLTLMQRAAPVVFSNTDAISIAAVDLNTSVILPANAFVDTDGEPVSGEITATITPIDTRDMGASYLGGGVALTDESDLVQLLSLGMIDFGFSQDGQPLQLAPGASAQIGMDLVTTSGPDGRVYVVGEEIEMWWFDDSNGLWVEEGLGEIVYSETSPTGMRLIATVEHFTTWNWDYYADGEPTSFYMTCTIEGLSIASNESCTVVVSNPGLTRSMVVPASGVSALNLPAGMAFDVYATSSRGGINYAGSTQFTTVAGGNDVAVDLVQSDESLPVSRVSCFVRDGSEDYPVQCKGYTEPQSGWARFLQFDPSTTSSILEIYPNEVLDIVLTIQGVQQTGTVSGPVAIGETVSYSFYQTGATGKLTCYGTLDGADGEFFPCAALVTDNLGNKTSVRTGDFSGNPMTSPFSFSPEATSATVVVVNSFNGKLAYLNDYINPYRGNVLSYNDYGVLPDPAVYNVTLGSDTRIDAEFDISSDKLFTYSCTYNGADYPCIAGSTIGENWMVEEAAPSWMLNKMVINNFSRVESDIYVSLDDPDNDPDYYLSNESVDIDYDRRHLTIRLVRILVPPPQV